MSDRNDAEAGGPYAVALTDSTATDRALVGGKGANLARLAGAGLPVPEGFCVTTRAYRLLTDDAAVAEAGAAVRTRTESLDVPEAVQSAVEAALGEAGRGPDETFAVRSSATTEDLPEASFAGQQETFLNVRGADVVDRVRDCMASLFTDRAIAYRARNGVSHEDAALAVVVQRMLDPDVSGVLFTADPTSGNRRVTAIEAGSGLGEAFVSGAAAADSVRVRTRTAEILDYEVGAQRTAVRPRSGGGTETVELPAVRTRRALTANTSGGWSARPTRRPSDSNAGRTADSSARSGGGSFGD